MGYKDKRPQLSIKEQFWHTLQEMGAFGESKKEAKENKTADKKIFSLNTMKTYKREAAKYADWLDIHYPDTKKMKASRSHVSEYLTERSNGTSAWTVQTAAKALGKLFQIKPSDQDYFTPPARKRENITRSRNAAVRDKHFSESKNHELVEFCRSVGPRVSELRKMKGKDLIDRKTLLQKVFSSDISPTERGIIKDALQFDGVNYFVQIKGKGGRERISPIIGEYAAQTVARFLNTAADEKVWGRVHSCADIHGYRADYATQVYHMYARNPDELSINRKDKETGKSEVYVCRKDKKRRRLDRVAMRLVSKALGHNREEVFAGYYLRDIA